jgi:hypothetical protein
MKTRRTLAELSERRLLERFDVLVRQDRLNMARLLAYMAEIDERKIWAKHACSSMFAFCTRRFHWSESVTAKRIWAARTARRFPVVLKMVADGELHLTAINLLGRHLTEANHREVLARARHKSSRQIELLAAELAPRPDVSSRVRALPRKPAYEVRANAEPPAKIRTDDGTHQRAVEADSPEAEPGEVLAAPAGAASAGPPRSSAAPRAVHRHVRKPIAALAPRRFKLEITVDQETHDQLRALQDLLRHKFPSADPALIVERAIELLLDDTLKKKAALTKNVRTSTRARTGRTRNERTRAIPAAIRRKVWKRDMGRCTFADENGGRCGETGYVEYHHEDPFGRGGLHEARNVTLRCRAHNQYQADLDFGREFMRRKREDAGLHSARNVRRAGG